MTCCLNDLVSTNGTRMVVLNVRRKILQCRIISKDRRFRGKVVLIPRIRSSPNAEILPVPIATK